MQCQGHGPVLHVLLISKQTHITSNHACTQFGDTGSVITNMRCMSGIIGSHHKVHVGGNNHVGKPHTKRLRAGWRLSKYENAAGVWCVHARRPRDGCCPYRCCCCCWWRMTCIQLGGTGWAFRSLGQGGHTWRNIWKRRRNWLKYYFCCGRRHDGRRVCNRHGRGWDARCCSRCVQRQHVRSKGVERALAQGGNLRVGKRNRRFCVKCNVTN